MKAQSLFLFMAVVLLSLFLNCDVRANRAHPGSCLIFPYYEVSEQCVNLITISNVDPDLDVWVRIVWIDDNNCDPFDHFIHLTPKDTFTFTPKAMVPYYETGFLYAYVIDEEGSSKERDADCLVGQEIVVSNWDNQLANFSVNAISFQCLDCDPDGRLELNGDEYTLAPKTLYFPRFLGQSDFFFSKIILINLTGGQYFDVMTQWLVTNDNEHYFSVSVGFDCFEVYRLNAVSNMFSNTFLLGTMHDLSEPFGLSTVVETGQFQITGAWASSGSTSLDDPSVYAVLIENAGGLGYTYADLPFITVDSAFKHGVLWPTDPWGF